MKKERRARSEGGTLTDREDEESYSEINTTSPSTNYSPERGQNPRGRQGRKGGYHSPGRVGGGGGYRAAGPDQRRTQSERRASSRPRRPAWSRQIDKHVRATWETVSHVKKQVRAFQREHLNPRSNFDFPACVKCLEEKVIPGWESYVSDDDDDDEGDEENVHERRRRGNRPVDLKDYEDFLNLSLRRGLDKTVVSSDEYIDLVVIARRARQFELLVPDSRRRLQICFEKHAKPNFTSLKHLLSAPSSSPSSSSPSHNNTNNISNENDDACNTTFHSVEEYEKALAEKSSAAERTLKDLSDKYKSYKKTLRPFVEFVKNGETHSVLIDECCSDMLELCKILETWAGQEDSYPESLVKEMEEKKKQREELLQSTKQIKADKEEKIELMAKLKRKAAKAAQRFTEYRNCRERLHLRLGELREKAILLDGRLRSKRDERDQLRQEGKDENSDSSPRRSQALSERLDKMEEVLEKLEKERVTTRKQIRRVEDDIKPAGDRAYENKVEMVTHRHQREDLEKECRRLDAEVVSLREQMALLDEQREKLVYIRELKISPEAYRKSLREMRRQQASKDDGTKYLTEACQRAAPILGKQWRKLYFLLPFDPARGQDKRQRDVILLDTLASRQDMTEAQAALSSLQKWQTFHRRGGVPDLALALRAMRRGALATEIENTYTAQARTG